MSVENYKRQATRLSEHLSTVHKVRLKHASSLEAIAAIHERRDWNTLAASAATPEAAQPAGASTSGQPAQAMSAQEAHRVLFSRHTFADPHFCDALLSQHVLLTEGYEGEKRAAMDHLIVRQIQRGGGFLYLGACEPQTVNQLGWAMAQAGRSGQFRLLAPSWGEDSEPFNPLCVREPDALAAITLKLFPAEVNNPGADFYRQQANYALTVIFGALLELDEELSFQKLADMLAHPERELTRLEERLPEDSMARLSLANMTERYKKKTKSGVEIDRQRIFESLGGIGGRIAHAAQTLRKTNAGKTAQLSWADILQNGDCVALQTDLLAGPTEMALLGSYEAALSELETTERPFTVFVDRSGSWTIRPEFARRLARKGIGLIMNDTATPSIHGILGSISAAGGFGRSATVTLKDPVSGASTTAELLEYKGWPNPVPRYQRVQQD
jgi:hypothetical protein